MVTMADDTIEDQRDKIVPNESDESPDFGKPKPTDEIPGTTKVSPRIMELVELEERIRATERVPLGTRLNLYVNPEYLEPGYHHVWAPDKDNGADIEEFLRAGYTFVRGRRHVEADANVGRGKQIGSFVTVHLGGGVTGYLMKIPDEIFQADMRARARKRKMATRKVADDVQGAPGITLDGVRYDEAQIERVEL